MGVVYVAPVFLVPMPGWGHACVLLAEGFVSLWGELDGEAWLAGGHVVAAVCQP